MHSSAIIIRKNVNYDCEIIFVMTFVKIFCQFKENERTLNEKKKKTFKMLWPNGISHKIIGICST